jgi:hypothetical protein
MKDCRDLDDWNYVDEILTTPDCRLLNSGGGDRWMLVLLLFFPFFLTYWVFDSCFTRLRRWRVLTDFYRLCLSVSCFNLFTYRGFTSCAITNTATWTKVLTRSFHFCLKFLFGALISGFFLAQYYDIKNLAKSFNKFILEKKNSRNFAKQFDWNNTKLVPKNHWSPCCTFSPKKQNSRILLNYWGIHIALHHYK